MRTLTAMLLVVSVALGCSESRTYQVSIANHTHGPITFGVVKHGEPFEEQWAAPEEVESNGGRADPSMWAAIAPGKTAVSGPLKGRFDKHAVAYLRVLQGKLDLPMIMAIDRGQPNRLDLVLDPGMNRFVIIDQNGHFEAVRSDAPATQVSMQ